MVKNIHWSSFTVTVRLRPILAVSTWTWQYPMNAPLRTLHSVGADVLICW